MTLTSDEITFIKCRIRDWFDYADGWLKDHESERPGSEDFNPSDIAQATKDRDICKSILAKLDDALSVTEQFLGSRESCEDKDAWDDFNKAIEEE